MNPVRINPSWMQRAWMPLAWLHTQPFKLGLWAVGIFVLALLLRLVQLDSVPANLNPDEADTLTTYLVAKQTGFPTLLGFNWNGAPALNTYVIGAAWELSGRTLGGLRLPSALISALSCSLFFVLLALAFRRITVAVGLSLLLMTNPWFLNFSRSGWENIWNSLALLLIVLGFYLLYERRAAQPEQPHSQPKPLSQTVVPLSLLMAGAVMGFYFYHPGKLFLPAVFLLLLVGQFTPAYRIAPRALAFFVVITGLLILPQLAPLVCTNIATQLQLPILQKSLAQPCQTVNEEWLHLARAEDLPLRIQPDGWHRISRVSVLTQEEPWARLQASTSKNVVGFLRFARADFDAPLNSRYLPAAGRPLASILALLYLMGLGVVAVRYPYLLLFYLWVLLPVQILSINTPDAARAVHVLPLLFFFMAAALDLLLDLGQQYGRRLQMLAPWLTGIMIVIVGVMALNQTWVYWEWIQSPAALEAREPAITEEEYSEWLQSLIERIQVAQPTTHTTP